MSLEDMALNIDYLQYETAAALRAGDDASAEMYLLEQYEMLGKFLASVTALSATVH